MRQETHRASILQPSEPLFGHGAMRARGRHRSPVRLAPLIDVVFILLVFFMLASSFLEWRTIPLGAPGQGEGGASVVGALLVDVRSDDLRLGGESVSAEGLSSRVTAAVKASPDRHVLVRPDAGVPLQRSVEVLDLLEAAGARNVSLVSGLAVQ